MKPAADAVGAAAGSDGVSLELDVTTVSMMLQLLKGPVQQIMPADRWTQYWLRES